MNNMYTVLGNLQIIFQIILWLLSFYWLDFELFTYIILEEGSLCNVKILCI